MAYKSIGVHLAADRRTDVRARLATVLARRFEAHLEGVFVVPPLILPVGFGSPAPLIDHATIEAQRRAMEGVGDEVGARFLRLAEAEGVPAEAETVAGDPGQRLAGLARYADLVLVGQSEEEGLGALTRQLPEQVVLGSGRGVIVVPYAGSFEDVGRRVVLAWNDSREAARAATEAMPLLVSAQSVTVFEMDPADGSGGQGRAFARSLARHGIRAEARHTVTAGVAPGEILLSTVAEIGADLLVMGAYGHSRLREVALGGVTRSVLAHMTVPVLMAS
jgi:nucleotide-binding universal stress UspA family protein